MQENFSIILSAGRSCFVKCLGCYNFFGQNKELTTTNVITNFLSYAKAQGVEKVTIGGGDPLSRPDILELLRQVKELGFRINLDTVGTPILQDVETIFHGKVHVPRISAEKISSIVDMIGIPLDGSRSSIHSFRTGRPDLFDEQLRIIETLSSYNANICINTLVHKHNHQHVHELSNIIATFPSIKKWQCFQFMPIGPLGYKNRLAFSLSDPLFEQTKERSLELASRILPNCSVEFKSRTHRKGKYLLIDTDGTCWLPKTTQASEWNVSSDTNSERIIIGNINSKSDYSSIIQAVLKPTLVLDRIECPTREHTSLHQKYIMDLSKC